MADVLWPYTLPVAAVALIIGHRRRTSIWEAGSWPAYGAGLGVTALPSIATTWADGLGAAAPPGRGSSVHHRRRVRTYLKAPLVIGGGILVMLGFDELAPAVVQLLGLIPRWLPLAAAGLLLLLLGGTYEKRIDEARRLRDTVSSMG